MSGIGTTFKAVPDETGRLAEVFATRTIASTTSGVSYNGSTSDNQTNGLQQVRFSDDGTIDAFGRLRISHPKTLFDGTHKYEESALFFETKLTGGATITTLPNESSFTMDVTTASGDICLRQTREYFPYSPGKSHLGMFSRVFGATKANVRRRVGLFDADNGVFFEDDGTDFGVVIRSGVTGSPVDTRVAQSAWNGDKLDGTGASGVTLDNTKDNLFIIEYQWLGTGRVRWGIFIGGRIVYCHSSDQANVNTGAYMGTGSLPIRNELENTGTAASASELRITCNAVFTEDGNADGTGVPFAVGNGTTTIGVSTRRAVLSIRPKATLNGIVVRQTIEDLHMDMMATIKDAFYEVVYNGTIGGSPSWTSANSESGFEYDVAGTTVTGGIVIDSGYIPAASGSRGSASRFGLTSKLPLSLDSDGANPINLSIVVTAMSATSTVGSSLHWIERR